MSETSRASSVDGPSIDEELIGESTGSALSTELGTTTREEVDARTPASTSRLARLPAEDPGADGDMAEGPYRKRCRLLDWEHRPTPDAPAFAACFFIRGVAGAAGRPLWACSQRNGTGSS
ncbi:hypothetical protein [Streptomyces sudanensis]|uniref:hypothetical protein n=1 Tax=Streptomyces sudanensis TaxID=436397 RepID=UPI0020CEA2C4|nr:hypothetical protein [Streptomyces sudanensis]MCP9958454.1 hypothetical protein [Streptomyces sudanensis]MCQ0001032.1 hypothetical protein [Streptomyces sudanensis]